MTLVHVGQGNYVAVEHIVAVSGPSALPVRKRINDARTHGTLIDVTMGRRTRSVVFTDDGQLVLAAASPDTINARLNSG